MHEDRVFIRPLHVVHIDDAVMGRQLVCTLLEGSEYPHFVVHGFGRLADAEAWSLQRQPADALLLDLLLAESSGMDTFLHALSVFQQIPIVILTGVHDTDLAYRMVCAGADAYLVKGQDSLLALTIAVAVARRVRGTSSQVRMTLAMRSIMETSGRLQAQMEASSRDE